jgi:Zn-dependent protease with chaperone function
MLRLKIKHLTAAAIGMLVIAAAPAPQKDVKLPLIGSVPEATSEQVMLRPFLVQSWGVIKNTPVDAHMQQIMQKIAVAAADRSKATPLVYVSPIDEMLAEAGAGGAVMITTGTLNYLRNEAKLANDDTLAFILAHEAAHVYLGHTADRETTKFWTGKISKASLIAGALLGGQNMKSAGTTVILAALGESIVSNGSLFPNWSRSQEFTADKLAVDLMVKAGYSTATVGALMQALIQTEGRQKEATEKASKPTLNFGLSRLFGGGNHPLAQERDEAIRKYILEKYEDVVVPLHTTEFKKAMMRPDVTLFLQDSRKLTSGTRLLYANDFVGGAKLIQSVKSPSLRASSLGRYAIAFAEVTQKNNEGKFMSVLQQAADDPLALEVTYRSMIIIRAKNEDWIRAYGNMVVAFRRFGQERYLPHMVWIAKKAGDETTTTSLDLACTTTLDLDIMMACSNAATKGIEPGW